jgi:hypothetical protein
VIHLLESCLDRRVARIFVRMKLTGELAVGFLEDFGVGVLGDTENRVQVFGHRGWVGEGKARFALEQPREWAGDGEAR